MSGQIMFFEKSKCDFALSGVSASASQGNDYANKALNRSNNDGWVTSGSVDADNTTWTVDFGESRSVTTILMLLHNFKAFTVKYYNSVSYVDFSTPISETTNTAENNYYSFAAVQTQYIQITITGTMVANADKVLRQFIATELIGQLTGWPVISPTLSRNKRISTTLSGKKIIKEATGFRKEKLKIKLTSTDADLTIFETLVYANEGFLYWPCGNLESQFRNERIGYRMEDIYLMKISDEWTPAWYDGLYKTGMQIDVNLEEVAE